MAADDKEKREVGYLFALAYSMGEGASLTLSGNFAVGAAKDFMDQELDKCYAVMERQRAKVMIPVIEEKLRIEEKNLDGMQAQLNEMSASVKEAYEKDRQPNGATLNNVKTLEKNIEITNYNIGQGRAQLESLKRMVQPATLQ